MRRLLIALAVSVVPSLAIAGHGHSGGHSGGMGVGASSSMGARMSGPVGGAARGAVPMGRSSGARIANMGGPWKGQAGGWSKGMHHGHHHHRHGRFFFAGAPWFASYGYYSCWRWANTPWGPQRVWVCDYY
jgi:hypothetical protein